jgi:hypothetical protein
MPQEPRIRMHAAATATVLALVAAACGSPAPTSSGIAGVATPGSSSTDVVGPTSTVSPTPAPTPALVPAPLTGLLVSPEAAQRHPIAVMVDDLSPARPQSGFGAASVVWQAPAEGGIPRYMMIFGENRPEAVGPVRSARYYYIAWAAEWDAVYAHAGGSPQALTTLWQNGSGQLVYNADQFAWGPFFQRVTTRSSPHNLYTDGRQLDALVTRLGVKPAAVKPIWQFAADAPLGERPVGGRIVVSYPSNTIQYDYDRLTNSYPRTVSVEGPEIDAATNRRVAPKNVVVMLMAFGPLNDANPEKHRLEAQVIGTGVAWIATNGRTIKGTWRKASLTDPTRFFDSSGSLVTLTAGQTFVQVMPIGSVVSFKAGAPPPAPTTSSRWGTALPI